MTFDIIVHIAIGSLQNNNIFYKHNEGKGINNDRKCPQDINVPNNPYCIKGIGIHIQWTCAQVTVEYTNCLESAR